MALPQKQSFSLNEGGLGMCFVLLRPKDALASDINDFTIYIHSSIHTSCKQPPMFEAIAR